MTHRISYPSENRGCPRVVKYMTGAQALAAWERIKESNASRGMFEGASLEIRDEKKITLWHVVEHIADFMESSASTDGTSDPSPFATWF